MKFKAAGCGLISAVISSIVLLCVSSIIITKICSRQKRKKGKGHGKRKKLAANEKFLRQKKIAH